MSNDMKRLFKFGKSKNPKSLTTTDALGPGPATAASTIVTNTADPMLSVLAGAVTASAHVTQAAGVTVSVQRGPSHR